MKRERCLLCETVQYSENDQILILNSAADPFVREVVERFSTSSTGGHIVLAEDNVALAHAWLSSAAPHTMDHVAFHDCMTHIEAEMMDVAVMNLLYQPNNSWMHYGLQVARHALKAGGRLYVVGAKERGILSLAKHIAELFGPVETLEISKGQRVLLAHANKNTVKAARATSVQTLRVFADNKLDEGTRFLLEALEVHVTDEALDLGCGAGLIGLHIARLASKGTVTMVDVSLAAVAATRQAIMESQQTYIQKNVRVLPSDGVQAVLTQRFDLVATNPPFHQGGIQSTATAERFIREAAQVLRPQGRFYLVANRFLKYEPTLYACFQTVEEVAGDKRYKVLRATQPLSKMSYSS